MQLIWSFVYQQMQRHIVKIGGEIMLAFSNGIFIIKSGDHFSFDP